MCKIHISIIWKSFFYPEGRVTQEKFTEFSLVVFPAIQKDQDGQIDKFWHIFLVSPISRLHSGEHIISSDRLWFCNEELYSQSVKPQWNIEISENVAIRALCFLTFDSSHSKDGLSSSVVHRSMSSRKAFWFCHPTVQGNHPSWH